MSVLAFSIRLRAIRSPHAFISPFAYTSTSLSRTLHASAARRKELGLKKPDRRPSSTSSSSQQKSSRASSFASSSSSSSRPPSSQAGHPKKSKSKSELKSLSTQTSPYLIAKAKKKKQRLAAKSQGQREKAIYQNRTEAAVKHLKEQEGEWQMSKQEAEERRKVEKKAEQRRLKEERRRQEQEQRRLKLEKRRQEQEQIRLEKMKEAEEQQRRLAEFDAERAKGVEELIQKVNMGNKQKELVAEMKAKMRVQTRESRLKSLQKWRSGWKFEIGKSLENEPSTTRMEEAGIIWKNTSKTSGSKPFTNAARKSAEPSSGGTGRSQSVSKYPRKSAEPLSRSTGRSQPVSQYPRKSTEYPRQASSKLTTPFSSSTASVISKLKSAQARFSSSSALSRSSLRDASLSSSSPSRSSYTPSRPKPKTPVTSGGLPLLKEFYKPPPSHRVTGTMSFTQRKGKLSPVLKSAHSKIVSLFTSFTSPPLLPGLVSCLHGMLGSQASPTEIQRLSIGKVVESFDKLDDVRKIPEGGRVRFKEYLLASETGSGKSIAYLLPLLQSLKSSELRGFPSSSSSSASSGASQTPRREYHPRSLILTPTHELARQISGFSKTLSHDIKLKVVCSSRANDRNRKGSLKAVDRPMRPLDFSESMSTTGSIETEGQQISDGVTELDVQPSRRGSSSLNNLLEPIGRPVDVMVGTPMKLLEMVFGRGWDREDGRKGRPEMGLDQVEWVVVDEADVLFDPDFNSQTRLLLSEISKARGQEVAFVKEDPTLSAECYPDAPSAPEPQGDATVVDLSTGATSTAHPTAASTSTPTSSYPFNFLLTTATIPPALSTYLDLHHPSMVRLSSSGLHRLPQNLKIEKVEWTGGNKYADIEKRLRKVWMEDERRSAVEDVGVGSGSGNGEGDGTSLSKVIVFCNKSNKVEELGTYLETKGIKTVTLTSKIRGSAEASLDEKERRPSGMVDRSSEVVSEKDDTNKEKVDQKSSERLRGSNKHLAGFLRVRERSEPAELQVKSGTSVERSSPRRLQPLVIRSKTATGPNQNPLSATPHVLLTTSLLSRGLDFSPQVRHVFIVDEPRNVVDFLHRAGRTGRAGGEGVVVVFGKGGKNKGKDYGWRGASKGGSVLQKLQE
ncbi:hypothetical protein D9757_001040 [Collybiopsis confluens]|uniref:RNA helicase n=1 Tax=Collybiopsis confluens TaxID=2823264 RepID=A0A8H5MG59_9AGAR|nr:hypothetical protein D9757_001040 [Collybiopsis confluens]